MIDTRLWRVETERPVMEEAPRWLEHDVSELEEGESKGDVPLLAKTNVEEEIDNVSQPIPPPPQR